MVCGGLTEQNIIKKLLVFTKPLQQNNVRITYRRDSRDPVVQAAQTMTLPQIYNAMRASASKTRNEWVYGVEQCKLKEAAIGLQVQQLFESILGVWVDAPAEQNQAIDARLGDCAISFKTTTAHGKVGFFFRTGKSKNITDVDVVVVGFRTNGHMTSLGVMNPTSVDWIKANFYWGLAKPFPGTLNIKTRDALLDALRLHSGKTLHTE